MVIHRLKNENSTIQVSYRGLPPIPVTSWLLGLFLIMVTGAVAVLAYQGLAPKLSEDWYWRFDWWWRVVLYMMIFVGPIVFISACVLRFMPFGVNYVKSACWDSSIRKLSIKRSRLLGLLSRESVFDLDELGEIEAVIGEELGGPIEFDLHFFSMSQPDEWLTLQVKDVDRRHEVLDVLFSIARQCGLSHYSIQENETDSMGVVVGRNGEQVIPPSAQRARYDLDEMSTPVRAPMPEVAPLEASVFKDWRIGLKEWEPGRLIRFRRPAPALSTTLWIGIGCGLIAGVITAFMSEEIASGKRVVLSAAVACGVAVVAMVVHRLKNLEYDVLIDQGSGRIDWRSGMRSRTMQLSEVKQIVLRGFEQRVKPKNRASYTLYRCGLFLVFDNRSQLLLIENDDWNRSSEEPRCELEPLAAALEQAIGVPWSWRGHQSPPLARFVERLVQFAILLLLIAGAGFLAWGVWTQGKYQAQYDALAKELEKRGATVTQAGVDVGNVSIFGDGFMVEIKDSGFDDQDLRDLLQEFQTLEIPQLLALDLAGTRITDQGVASMADYSRLFMVDLQGTAVTAQAIETLARTGCTAIDVRDTAIRLEDLKPFDGVYSLKVIKISDSEVSNSDLQILCDIPYLDAVLIGDAEQTSVALDRIRDDAGWSTNDLQVAGEVHYRLD